MPVLRTRDSILSLTALAFAIMLSGCAGGNAGGGGGGGGGGVKSSISLLAPSSVMPGNPVLVTVLGRGFTDQSQVLADGQPVTQTVVIDSRTLDAHLDDSFFVTPSIHQLTVQTGGSVSNALPFTVYSPQPGPQVMQAMPSFLVGDFASNPAFCSAGDVNGDGLADVVMAGPALLNSRGSIAIFYGQANGLLSDVHYLPAPATPYALAVGDVDGNGTADLVAISNPNFSGTIVNVWLGDGHGNFQQASAQEALPTGVSGRAFLADLDGDGRPDLVLAVAQPTGFLGNIVWLQNTGGGNFAVPVILTAAALDNGDFSIADLNHDGRSDILYTAPGSPESLHILTNQGNAHFSDQAVAGLNGVFGAASVIDFNLDGLPDLVVQVAQGTVALYSFVGNGNGSFSPVSNITIAPLGFRVYTLVTGDFDHDGFPDLAGINGETEPGHILYLFGDGRGNFVLQQVVGPEGVSIALGDFNGDGIPDVVVPDLFNFVSLAVGRSDRNFPSPLSLNPTTATTISAGDINGDGLPEIFVGGNPIFNIPGTVFLNAGNNSFQFAANTDNSSYALADMTGKGVFDLLGGPGSYLTIWPNNGTLDFSSPAITLAQPSANDTVADMDGDGHPDFVSACSNGCGGQVFYGNGSYQFNPVTVANLDWPYRLGDFNGDGRPDIVTGYAMFLNTGGQTFHEVLGNSLPLGNGVITAVADFNGDGKDDVALSGPGDLSVAIWYSLGDGTFYEGTLIDPGQYPGALAVGDFNGDGRPDLAVGLILSHQVCLFLNTGQGQFTRSFFASGADAIGMVASDLNRDGKPDLAVTNFMLSFRPANADVIFHK